MPAQINFTDISTVAHVLYEPRIVSRDITPTVKAQVDDALWMLTQQWRVGEFKGDDAGTLIKAKIETQSTTLNRFQSKKGTTQYLDLKVPLEARVEKLPLVWDLGMQITVGFQWMKLLKNQGFDDIVSLYITNLAIEDDTSDNPQKASNVTATQVRGAVVNNIVDGQALVAWFTTHNASDIPGLPSMNSTQINALNALKTTFSTWFQNTYYQPVELNDNSWNEQKFEYEFKVSLPNTSSANAAQTVLTADKYKDGNLDWYSFDVSSTSTNLAEGGISNDVISAPNVKTYIPHTIEFKGMPKGRWWEFEDKNVDLAKMLAQKQDITKLVVTEFGLIYSNDWFVIPHTVPDASLTKINGLVVTDVFGQQFRVNRAGTSSSTNWQTWDMYSLNTQGNQSMPSSDKLLMAPSLRNRLESDPIEKVLMLRDEMANMVWGVEEVVPNELMGGMDGKNAANELQKYLAANYTPLEPATYIPNIAEQRFSLSNAVPENWIPFIATKQSSGSRAIMLQRAAMRRYISDNYTNETIIPRTNILLTGLERIAQASFNGTSTQGFAAYGGNTITVQSGRLRASVAGMFNGTWFTFNTVVGKKYRIRYNIDLDYDGTVNCTLVRTVGWTYFTSQAFTENSKNITFEFTADTTQLSLVIEAVSVPSAPSYFYVSDFVIEATNPYFINEEATSRSGFVISTNFQRTRWYDGRTYTWLGRKVQSGRGEGSSGLKFDILTDKEADTDAIDIPFNGISGWWKADSPENSVAGGIVNMLKDLSGNGLDLSPGGTVGGPTMDSVNGVPAMSFNQNLLRNTNTINIDPISGYDSCTIFHVGDGGIGRGFDDVGVGGWSFSVSPTAVGVVLTNGGDAEYDIGLPVTSGQKITTFTLEQNNPVQSAPGFGSRITAYDDSGNLIPGTNNPYVTMKNHLRDNNTVGFTMGATGVSTGYRNGHVFETIVYRRVLSSDEIQKVLTYLKNKYNAVL